MNKELLDKLESLKKLAKTGFEIFKLPEDTKCTVAELVRRGNSLVRVDGKIYEVSVKEIEITK